MHGKADVGQDCLGRITGRRHLCFVYQYVDTLAMRNDFARRGRTRVARKEDRATFVVNSITQGCAFKAERFACFNVDRQVFDIEGRNLQPVLVKKYAGFDIRCVQLRPFLVHADDGAVADIPVIRSLEIRHHRRGAAWSEYLHWRFAAEEPASQPQPRCTDRVIEMQMCDQQMVNGGKHFEATCLKQSFTHAGTRVDHYPVIPGLDQDGGTVAIMRRARCAGAQESQLDLAVVACKGKGHRGYTGNGSNKSYATSSHEEHPYLPESKTEL